MALLDKFRQLADAREALARLGEDPFRATIERILSPTEAMIWRTFMGAGGVSYSQPGTLPIWALFRRSLGREM